MNIHPHIRSSGSKEDAKFSLGLEYQCYTPGTQQNLLNTFRRYPCREQECPVNVSSSVKAGFYPTPEFKNLLQSLNDLKREVSRFGKTHPDKIGYNRLIKNVDSLEESIREHYRELYAIEGALETATSRRLTDKQRMMLQIVSEVQVETLYTTLIERVSVELDIPKSTVRWNLKGLRDTGLITAGDRENKGVPVRLTEIGRVMAGVVSPAD
jgi:DNA-binding transcriptional ArsR family regulator